MPDGPITAPGAAREDAATPGTFHRAIRTQSEKLLASIFRAAPTGIGLVSNRILMAVNARICEMTGYSEEELVGRSARILYPSDGDFEYVGTEKYRQIRESGTGSVETRWQRKDGRIIAILMSSTPIDPDDLSAGVTFTALDITERKRAAADRKKLQEQLLHSQKMESVGRLAGGVAHDFNNMLGVILGHVELALLQTGLQDPVYPDLDAIRKAAQRSAELTRQLLAFARRQTVTPRVLDLNGTITGMLGMLRRIIGEDIDLGWAPGDGLWPTRIDPAQIDQILVNLVVNARDAIAGTGKVTIETGNIRGDAARGAGPPDLPPGDYVMLAVGDDGCGMETEVRSRIFEPFFTTKEVGQGTGLGLATVFGIVKQNEGFIDVHSEPGTGSVFRIYFPRHAGEPRPAPAPAPKAAPESRGETILLVEDEAAVLSLGKTLLEHLGYRVLAAGSPREAISRAESFRGKIDLLVTDLIMPEMNGRQLRRRLRSIRPEIKCLYMSGYTANVIAGRGVLEEGVHFLQKPFSIPELSAGVREALDAPELSGD
jgi:PAS domain S-box-containing protein